MTLGSPFDRGSFGEGKKSEENHALNDGQTSTVAEAVSAANLSEVDSVDGRYQAVAHVGNDELMSSCEGPLVLYFSSPKSLP